TAVPEKNEAWSTNHDLCQVPIDNRSPKWKTLTGDNKAADASPRFSPDGKKLAYRAQKKAGYEADKWDILVVDCNPNGSFAGKSPTLTGSKGVSVSECVWLADSKTVLFTADSSAGTSVWETHVSDGEVQPFAEGGTMAALSVSRDGNRLAVQQAALNHPARV